MSTPSPRKPASMLLFPTSESTMGQQRQHLLYPSNPSSPRSFLLLLNSRISPPFPPPSEQAGPGCHVPQPNYYSSPYVLSIQHIHWYFKHELRSFSCLKILRAFLLRWNNVQIPYHATRGPTAAATNLAPLPPPPPPLG